MPVLHLPIFLGDRLREIHRLLWERLEHGPHDFFGLGAIFFGLSVISFILSICESRLPTIPCLACGPCRWTSAFEKRRSGKAPRNGPSRINKVVLAAAEDARRRALHHDSTITRWTPKGRWSHVARSGEAAEQQAQVRTPRHGLRIKRCSSDLSELRSFTNWTHVSGRVRCVVHSSGSLPARLPTARRSPRLREAPLGPQRPPRARSAVRLQKRKTGHC